MATRVEALEPRARLRVRLWLGLAALVLLATGGVGLLVAWLSVRNYAPLEFAGGGSGVTGAVRTVDPVAGSQGKTVYFAPQTTHASLTGYFDVTNTGDRAVRLERVYTGRLIPGATPSFTFVRARILTEPETRRVYSPKLAKPFEPLTIRPHHSVMLVLHYRTACSADAPVGATVSGSSVKVGYSYLHVFHWQITRPSLA